ncbi:Two-pore calcium channel protein 2 (Voltage-dependent calcium channel protein TPC2) [Fasciolopsis buskii]|uniref:Two-pore calcium channel protein 2 (Voltage-dependent calcium channel protein TPC2) n=1 Tax=Fasciolopsis buskii TaxID=27845 RepID=A0A8E0RVH2_9TREM|nr:Two-pore calcium channel protein 2 (Voltage-dependent calcium channel protein TPC2) [Fasciolopsis buski]
MYGFINLKYVSLFAESDLTASQFMELFRAVDQNRPPCEVSAFLLLLLMFIIISFTFYPESRANFYLSDQSSFSYCESPLRTVSSGYARWFQGWIISSSFSKLSIAVSFLNIVSLAVDLSERATTSVRVGGEMRVSCPSIPNEVRIRCIPFVLLSCERTKWKIRSFHSQSSDIPWYLIVLLLSVSDYQLVLCHILRCRASLFDLGVWSTNILLKNWEYFWSDHSLSFIGTLLFSQSYRIGILHRPDPKLLECNVILMLFFDHSFGFRFLIFTIESGHETVLNITLWDVVRLTNILLLTRAVRIVHLFTWTRLVAGVLRDLPRNLTPVLGILATAYYVYALLGMNLFREAIRFNPNDTARYECGTYQQLEYWPSSLVLLWDLMVVNNWFIIVNAYREAVGLWVHVYMISWWLLAPVGLLSLVTAFVIEVRSFPPNAFSIVSIFIARCLASEMGNLYDASHHRILPKSVHTVQISTLYRS